MTASPRWGPPTSRLYLKVEPGTLKSPYETGSRPPARPQKWSRPSHYLSDEESFASFSDENLSSDHLSFNLNTEPSHCCKKRMRYPKGDVFYTSSRLWAATANRQDYVPSNAYIDQFNVPRLLFHKGSLSQTFWERQVQLIVRISYYIYCNFPNTFVLGDLVPLTKSRPKVVLRRCGKFLSRIHLESSPITGHLDPCNHLGCLFTTTCEEMSNAGSSEYDF